MKLSETFCLVRPSETRVLGAMDPATLQACSLERLKTQQNCQYKVFNVLTVILLLEELDHVKLDGCVLGLGLSVQ